LNRIQQHLSYEFPEIDLFKCPVDQSHQQDNRRPLICTVAGIERVRSRSTPWVKRLKDSIAKEYGIDISQMTKLIAGDIDRLDLRLMDIEEQMKLNREQQDGERQTKLLVNEFQQLANKSELSAKEQKRLQEIQAELDRKYPKLIDQTKSYKENLNGVAEIGKATTTELGRLKNENDKLEIAFAKTAQRIAFEKRNLAIESVRDVAPISTEDFVNALFNAKNEDAVRKAKFAFLVLTQN
jgi:hypothetical protein